MIDDELFLIILNELAVKDGSVFALKIKARLYNNEYAGKNDEWSKAEHRRMINLKQQFAFNKKPKKLSDIANDMLNIAKKGVD